MSTEHAFTWSSCGSSGLAAELHKTFMDAKTASNNRRKRFESNSVVSSETEQNEVMLDSAVALNPRSICDLFFLALFCTLENWQYKLWKKR